MPVINEVLHALNERTLARAIGIPHDEARMAYALPANTVRDFREFEHVIGTYVNHHYMRCIAPGGLSAVEALGRAKEILEREARRRRGDLASAFSDACDGTNGGLRAVLDTIAEALKAESIERYVRDVFDRYVSPVSYEEKVALIGEFIEQCGPYLSRSIDADRPERYAHDYRELVRSYVDGLRETSAAFRRL